MTISRRRWEDITKAEPREIFYEYGDWIKMPEAMLQGRTILIIALLINLCPS
jgi:hypothetical protein